MGQNEERKPKEAFSGGVERFLGRICFSRVAGWLRFSNGLLFLGWGERLQVNDATHICLYDLLERVFYKPVRDAVSLFSIMARLLTRMEADRS